MKKKISILVILAWIIGILFISGCGVSSGKEKSPCEGKWIAVSAQMMGMSVEIEETFGGAFEFEVKKGGKVSVLIGEDTGKGKWKAEEDQFTLTIEGEDMVGVLGENTISFDDMLGMGVKIIFAKEGTEAMNPDLYLTEEESQVLGQWMSESVEELLGDGPQTSMDGVEDIHDALRLEFKNDRSVAVAYKGQEIGTFPWSAALGYCTIETEDPSFTITINEDETLDVTYSTEEDYYTFHCIRNSMEEEK